ncbi:MAG: Lrp/AsnC family transcriptional regulator [Sarcina sp.]
MKIDDIDIKILKLLEENSKQSLKEIGEKLHMTGQAIGFRVTKLVEMNIIKNFTISINKSKLHITTSFIKVYMTTHNHSRIKNLISKKTEITEAFRVAGDGCYILRIETINNTQLNQIIDEINEFANYQISNVLSNIK